MAEKDATKKTARISVVCTEEERDAFFDWCRRQKPRRSMSEELMTHLRDCLGRSPSKPTPKRHSALPRDRTRKGGGR